MCKTYVYFYLMQFSIAFAVCTNCAKFNFMGFFTFIIRYVITHDHIKMNTSEVRLNYTILS